MYCYVLLETIVENHIGTINKNRGKPTNLGEYKYTIHTILNIAILH